MKTTFILLAALVLGLFACDDPPTEPQPFAQREPFDDDFILGRWQGEVVWGDNDSIDAFGVEFKYEYDTTYTINYDDKSETVDELDSAAIEKIQPYTQISLDTITSDKIDSLQDQNLIELLIRIKTLRTDSEYLNLETGLWESQNGLWRIDEPLNRLVWAPKEPDNLTEINERQMLYAGYRAGDSLYGYVTTAGYSGTWSMRKQNIIE